MRNFALIVVAVFISLLSIGLPKVAIAGGDEQQVCDVGADYSLGVENYLEAIRLHVEVVRKQPGNALAHLSSGICPGNAWRQIGGSQRVPASRNAWTDELGLISESRAGSAR